MDYTRLGGTDLKVSVISLGAGGSSRLGVKANGRDATNIVSSAVEQGIDLIDTAEGYGTDA